MLLKFVVPILLMFASGFASAPDPSIQVGGGTIDVNFDADLPAAKQTELMTWIHDAADSIVTYYGRFPLPHTFLEVRTFDGSGVHNGHTFPVHNGGLIRISVGVNSTPAQLKDDWTMTHEMVHLTFPNMEGRNHHWIEEGLAVYVEPIARVQAHNFSKEEAWGEMVRDMHQGEPQEGDEGLDNTHSWGRTYWGGCLFGLVADIEIHLRTGNKKGLQDALRGIMNAGGVITDDWEIKRAFQVGDKAVGVPVLEQLYEQWKDKPVTVDLDRLWQELGVSQQNGVASFNNNAPLAAVRDSITSGKPGKPAKTKFSISSLTKAGIVQ